MKNRKVKMLMAKPGDTVRLSNRRWGYARGRGQYECVGFKPSARQCRWYRKQTRYPCNADLGGHQHSGVKGFTGADMDLYMNGVKVEGWAV